MYYFLSIYISTWMVLMLCIVYVNRVDTWRIVDATHVKIQFQFEPADFWIGFFWRYLKTMPLPYATLHICVGIFPGVPIHITILLKRREVT
jgi:hypothetical protein